MVSRYVTQSAAKEYVLSSVPGFPSGLSYHVQSNLADTRDIV